MSNQLDLWASRWPDDEQHLTNYIYEQIGDKMLEQEAVSVLRGGLQIRLSGKRYLV